MAHHSLELSDLALAVADGPRPLGTSVFAGLVTLAEQAVASLRRSSPKPIAVLTRPRPGSYLSAKVVAYDFRPVAIHATTNRTRCTYGFTF